MIPAVATISFVQPRKKPTTANIKIIAHKKVESCIMGRAAPLKRMEPRKKIDQVEKIKPRAITEPRENKYVQYVYPSPQLRTIVKGSGRLYKLTVNYRRGTAISINLRAMPSAASGRARAAAAVTIARLRNGLPRISRMDGSNSVDSFSSSSRIAAPRVTSQSALTF